MNTGNNNYTVKSLKNITSGTTGASLIYLGYANAGKFGVYSSNSAAKIILLEIGDEPTSYTITYQPGEGASGTPISDNNISGQYTVRDNDGQNGNPSFSKTGHNFNGWNNGTSNVVAGANINVTSDVTLTAQWIPETYTITYKAGFGDQPDIEEAKTYNVAYTIADNIFDAPSAAHSFTGWKDSDNNDWAVGASYTGNAPLTLTAQWTTETFYTVTIADGIANGTVEASPTSATQGTQISLTANPSAGCGFTSWNVYKTGDQTTTVTVTDNKFNMPAYNVTVSATFTPYTVTLNAGTGSITPATWNVTMNEGNLPAASPSATCTEDGWTFYGWSTAVVNETTIAPTTMVQTAYVPTGNITLHAVYKITEANETVTTFNIKDIAAANGWSNSTQYSSIEISPVTLTASGGGNDGKYYSSDETWRFYSSSSGTVTVTSSGDPVTAVSSSPSKTFTISNGVATYTASSNTSFTQIVVTTGGDETTYNSNPTCLEKVETPNITLEAGTYTSVQTTTITCGTQDATIRYTTDGTDPTSTTGNVYSSAISINESMTIKAIAYKDEMADSEVASAEYVISIPLTTMQEIYTKASNIGSTATDVHVTFGGWVVTGKNDYNAYVTDGTNGFVINGTHGFDVGNTLTSTNPIACKLQLYNGYARITQITSSTEGLTVGTGGTVEVADIQMANLEGVNTGALVHYDNLTCTVETSKGTNYYLSDGTTTIQVYTTLNNSWSLVNGNKYNITGVYQQYGETKEILPRSAGDVVEVTKFTVTYWKNDGTQTKETASYYTGTTVTVAAANLFEAPGCHSFSEWNTDANGDGTPYNPGDQFNISANLELYARWAENSSFTVTYNVNGSTTAIEAATVGCGLTVSLPTASLEPLTFLGWATTEGDAVAYKAGADYGPTANVTLYAVFGSMNTTSLTITGATTDIPTSYGSGNWTIDSKTFYQSNILYQNPSQNKVIQFKAPNNNGFIYNKTDFGNIRSVKITYYSSSAAEKLVVYAGDSENPNSATNVSSSGLSNHVETFTISGNHKYICIYNTEGTDQVSEIEITYEATAPVTIINISDTPAEPTTSIPANSCIVVHDGGVLTFTGTNNDASKLIVQDGGQLKVTSNGSKDGGVKATVYKHINGVQNWASGSKDWNFIASPITEAFNPASTVMTSNNYDLYQLNNTRWENYKEHEGNANPLFSLAHERGYLYANSADVDLEFAGTVRAYDVDHTISVAEGWNLVGNPYTFDAYVNTPYYAMKADGSGITATTVATSTAVEPCTGIIINADEEGTVKFLDEAPVSSANNGNLQMILAHNVTSRDGASVNSTLDNAIVSFNEGTKLQKFYFGEPVANIFIPQNGEDYSIVYSDKQSEMPLNFKTKELGTYTISFEGEEMDLNGIYLIDMLAEEEIDLSVNPNYTFIGSPADRSARFKIVFKNTGGDNTSDIFAYQSGNDIIVTGEGELQIFDVMGRMIATQHVNGIQTINVNAQGVYIMKLNDKVQKIVIR